jgi:hypothetical protein
MAHMFDTLAVFHEPMLKLKAVALANMSHMFDTEATFHLLMSALKAVLPLNRLYMVLTALVSQSAMLPYVAAVVGFVTHAVTAVAMFAFVMAVCVLGVAVLGTAVLHRAKLLIQPSIG